ACADAITYRAREEKDVSDLLDATRRERQSAEPRPEPTAEESEAVRAMKAAHYRAWLEKPVPAFGGMTPRQAARDPPQRSELELILKEMQNTEARVPAAQRFDVTSVRRELGLELDQPIRAKQASPQHPKEKPVARGVSAARQR